MNRFATLSLCAFAALTTAIHAAQDDSRFIQFKAPLGGEIYVVGQMQKVQLKSSLKSLKIELSRDGGTTFETLGALDNKRAHGIFAWPVTAGSSSNAVIRASGSKHGDAITVTSATFSITTSLAAVGAPVPSGQASTGAVLAADGLGGSLFQSLLSLLPTVGAPYVLKAGDTMSGGLKIATPTTGLTVVNDALKQSTVAIGPTPPINGSLSIGTTQNSFNISVLDRNPNLLLSDSGTSGDTAGFVQFRDSDQVAIRSQLAAFSATHATKANWLSLSNFKAGPVVLSTSNTERMRVDTGGNVGVATAAPNSSLHVNGSLALAVRSSAVSATLTDADHTLVLTGAAALPTLPDATTLAGRVYVIKNRTGGPITPVTTAGQTIDGAAPAPLANGSALVLQSDGAGWNKIN